VSPPSLLKTVIISSFSINNRHPEWTRRPKRLWLFPASYRTRIDLFIPNLKIRHFFTCEQLDLVCVPSKPNEIVDILLSKMSEDEVDTAL